MRSSCHVSLGACALLVLFGIDCIAALREQIKESYREALRQASQAEDYLLPTWLHRSLNKMALTELFLAGMITGRDYIDPKTPALDSEAEKNSRPLRTGTRFAGSGSHDSGKSALRPAQEFGFQVWSPGDRTIHLIFHRVDGVRGIMLPSKGSSGETVEIQLFPTGKKGEVFANVKVEAVFFYDFGRGWGAVPVVPDRKPVITRGGKILKPGHIYRIHCPKEKIDQFIRIDPVWFAYE